MTAGGEAPDEGLGYYDYGAADEFRRLSAAALRAARRADVLAAAAGTGSAQAGRLRELALQALSTARAAAWAAGIMEAEERERVSVEVRLLSGRVSTGFGDKAEIDVAGLEPFVWSGEDIARQAGIPVRLLHGRVVSFAAEDWGDDNVHLHAFLAGGQDLEQEPGAGPDL